MIILLEGKSKKTASTGLFGSLVRGTLALLFLVLGAFAITMAATAVLIVGGILALAFALWWGLVGRKRIRELLSRTGQDFSSRANSSQASKARAGVTIEGELVREPAKSP